MSGLQKEMSFEVSAAHSHLFEYFFLHYCETFHLEVISCIETVQSSVAKYPYCSCPHFIEQHMQNNTLACLIIY